jgi:Flp pilus assembly protein CpaB
MQRKNTPVLLITILLGVLALGATAFLLLGGPRGTTAPPPVAVVPTPTPAAQWVAIRDIPPRTVVNSSMLTRQEKPGVAPEGAITSIDDISGKLTSAPILRGETLVRTSFTSALRRKVPANIPIPVGLRGVAIWVDPDQTAAGLVDVGDRVDVVATHKLSIDKAPQQFIIGSTQFTAGRTIAQNLLVLGVDESIKAPDVTPTPAAGAAPGAPGSVPPPPTPVPAPSQGAKRIRVVLAAPAETASRLIAANDQGTLNITIRNPSDGDAGLVPETKEYPSRTFFAAAKSSGSGTGNGNSTPSMPAPSREPMPMPTIPAPTETTLPAPIPQGTPDPNAGSKEITVIRGTEKTRVLVPQR